MSETRYDIVSHAGKTHLTRPGEQTTLCGRTPLTPDGTWWYRVENQVIQPGAVNRRIYCSRCLKWVK